MDLTRLRKLKSGVKLGDNALLITLGADPSSTYYLDPDYRTDIKREGAGDRSRARDAVERSRRETKMKKGVGLGGLHQCVSLLFLLTCRLSSQSW